MFTVKEHKEKFKRLEELKNSGFNTPRMFYMNQEADDILIENAISWAKEINDSSPDQIFNIRTYNYSDISKKETSQNPHLTDLLLEDLIYHLPTTNFKYACMIDAEIPDNGRIAGNIVVENKDSFSIEFVVKEKRAMVRDINTHHPLYSISGKYEDFPSLLSSFNSSLKPEQIIGPFTYYVYVLEFVLKKAFSFNKENIILEFTYFDTLSGIFYNQNKPYPESNVVWWEWRTF